MLLTIFRNACSREEDAQVVEGATVGVITGTGVVTTGGGIGEVGTDGDTVGVPVGTTTGAGLTSGLGGGDEGAVGADTGVEVAKGGAEGETGLPVGAGIVVVGGLGESGMDIENEPASIRSSISMSSNDLIRLPLLLSLISLTGLFPLLNIPNVRLHVDDSTLTGRSFCRRDCP
jgi:hypothetical protein